MSANRRNLIFRVSIVINIAVLLYAAMHLSGNSPNTIMWEDTERTIEREPFVRFVKDYDELTSQKTPSTTVVANKTTSSTMSISDIEKRVDVLNETLLESDEDELTPQTLDRLAQMLNCRRKEYRSRIAQRGDFWVLHNFVQADHGEIDCFETITYTTHAGFEFLDNVPAVVARWMGPISLAIHAPGADFQRTLDSIRYLRDCLSHDLVKNYVSFHIFFSNKHIPNNVSGSIDFLSRPYTCPETAPYNLTKHQATYKKSKNLLYPVNVARNIARDGALTHFILASDIELYPSPSIIPRFLNMIARNEKPLNVLTNPRVFPISIFEVDARAPVPKTKTELQNMLQKKTAIPFHKQICSHCHNIPKGKQWMQAPETKQMDVFHVGKRKGNYGHWEPVFIGTNDDPYYDERLSWEGKQDKMTQGYILCVKDYDFMILNNAFLIHKPGIKRYVRDPTREQIASKQSSFNKQVVIPELRKLFGSRSGCAL